MDQNEQFDHHHVHVLDFSLKGGPPWGFRIKQRRDKVFISKINCGGRGNRGGLRVHDEIIAVNNYDVDKYPLTLHRQTEDKENGEDVNVNPSEKLTKLDFTYQLIKHTLNRQLHLTVRRHSDSELARYYYYHGEDDEAQLDDQLQSEEEILSPSEDALDIVIPPPDINFGHQIEYHAGPSDIINHSDQTSDILPVAVSPDSRELEMPTIYGPTFKAKAPKNVWSPGSTSNSSSSTETTIPTAAYQSSRQETGQLPSGFRPVHLSDVLPLKADSLAPAASLSPTTSDTTLDLTQQTVLKPDISSSSPSETPVHKYWTLPRNIATSTKLQQHLEDLQQQEKHQKQHHRQIISDFKPPSNAKFLYETKDARYFAIPTEKTQIIHKKVIHAPPKAEGIGPLSESGIPLTTKPCVRDESDWYKTMFKRLHKYERPHDDLEEPLRIKLKSNSKYNYRDYRYTPSYFSEDESSSRHTFRPKNIADYEPGHSSISEREKQMEPPPINTTNQEYVNRLVHSQVKSNDDLIMSHRAQQEPYHHPNCVFNALTSGSGYESDSSYIIKKKAHKTPLSPAPRSTYVAVQRGDIDIPLEGLQRPAPQPRTHKVGPVPPLRPLSPNPTNLPLTDSAIDEWQQQITEDFNFIYDTLQRKQQQLGSPKRDPQLSPKRDHYGSTDNNSNRSLPDQEQSVTSIHDVSSPKVDRSDFTDSDLASPHQYNEAEVNIHYRAPVQHLVKRDVLNEEDLNRRQREIMRQYYEEEYERRTNKDTQTYLDRKHHFLPTVTSPTHFTRSDRSFAEKENSVHPPQVAKLLFDFQAMAGRELSAKKGDLILVHKSVNHNWVEAEDPDTGLKGLIPRTYLDFEHEGIAKTKFDFEAKTPVEISFKKGDKLTLMRKVDDNWYEGSNSKGEIGIFPCNYIDVIKQPLELRDKSSHSILVPVQSLSPFAHYHPPPVTPQRPESPKLFNGTIPQKRTEHHLHPASSKVTLKPKMYKVLYPYKPRQSDELELQIGDVLSVTMRCDDGWFIGQSTISGQYGTFPGNYVQEL